MPQGSISVWVYFSNLGKTTGIPNRMSEPQNWNPPYYCRLERVNSTEGAENESRLTRKTLKRDNALGRLEGKEASGIQRVSRNRPAKRAVQDNSELSLGNHS